MRTTRPTHQTGPDPREYERQRAADEIAERLRSRGVRLSGRETGEELVGLLDAVECFEQVVERRGGDLLVDEPIDGVPPIQPDDPAFVLPVRRAGESVAAFIGRIAVAAAHAAREPDPYDAGGHWRGTAR